MFSCYVATFYNSLPPLLLNSRQNMNMKLFKQFFLNKCKLKYITGNHNNALKNLKNAIKEVTRSRKISYRENDVFADH